jgi:hypothetical protein
MPPFWSKQLSPSEIVLAILAGITLPLALAPWIYYWYFEAIGWPVFSMTHPGPLDGAPLGDRICWGNVAMLIQTIYSIFLEYFSPGVYACRG